jgi:hypothetical protein
MRELRLRAGVEDSLRGNRLESHASCMARHLPCRRVGERQFRKKPESINEKESMTQKMLVFSVTAIALVGMTFAARQTTAPVSSGQSLTANSASGELVLADAEAATAKTAHHSGQQMLGEGIKKDGMHPIQTKGPHTATVEVRGGKVVTVHVKHATKGDIPVRKYKTDKKIAQSGAARYQNASFLLGQNTYLGTVEIGYAYTDDDGNVEIFWFPYDMILDGDTGAIIYVPAS